MPQALADPGWLTTDQGEFEAARFRLTVDLSEGTAVSELLADRRLMAQPPQGLSFDFDIDQFRTANSFLVTGLYADPVTGAVDVYFRHYHPFPIPNLTTPPTAGNRADLGYTGRLMVLAPGATRTYSFGAFELPVTLNPSVMLNADGYIRPRNLMAALRGTAPLADAFPYVLLVNEALNNRYEASNEGDPTGNYLPASGGWQRSNLGESNRGWTGYDYLHAGQSCSGTLSFRGGTATPMVFSVDVAILIKYTDPRGQGGPTYRLPPETVNASQFAYRLPYAAMDISRIQHSGGYTIGRGLGSTVDVEVKVRDWDAQAVEGTGSKVGDFGDITQVQQGAAGIPTGRIICWELSDFAVDLAYQDGNGRPGSELRYTATLTNENGHPNPGDRIFGLAEFVDPEISDGNRDSYHFGVDPVTVAALPGEAIEPRTWLPIVLTVPGPPPVPQILYVTPSGPSAAGDSFQEATFRVEYTGFADSFLWHFPEGGVEWPYDSPEFSTGQVPEATLRLSKPGTYTGYVSIRYDDDKYTALFPFVFRVLYPYSIAPLPPVIIDGGIKANGISSLQAGGRVQAAVYDDNTGQIFHFRATRNVPSDPTHWVKTLAATTATGLPQLALHNNRPVILFRNATPEQSSSIALCAVEQPTGPGDWTTINLAGNTSLHSDLVVTGNRLMFGYRNTATGIFEIARATAQVPDGTQWSYFSPNTGTSMPSSYGAPAMVVRSFTGNAEVAVPAMDGSLIYYRAESVSPTNGGLWTFLRVRHPMPGLAAPPIVASVFYEGPNQDPRIACYESTYNDNLLMVSNTYYPFNPGDWSTVEVQGEPFPIPLDWFGKVGPRYAAVQAYFDFPANFMRAYLTIAMRDRPAGPADFYTVLMDDTLGTGAGGGQAYVGIDAGVPKLMYVYAGGDMGFRQTVLNRDWWTGS